MALLTAVLGTVMVASSLGAKLVGLPRQAVRNWQRKTAPHAMRWFSALGFVSYTSQAAWALVKGDWVLFAVQVPGAAVIAVVLWQAVRYPDSG